MRSCGVERFCTMGLIWCLFLLINIDALNTLSRKRSYESDDVGKVILEDTYSYKSDMNWTVHREKGEHYDQYDYYDGQFFYNGEFFADSHFLLSWEDMTGQDRHRTYSVCDITDNINWLRSKYIKIQNRNYRDVEVTIEIEFSFPDCSSQDLECGSIFDVYRFESATDRATDEFPVWSDSPGGYSKMKTIAAQDRFGMSDDMSEKISHVSRETLKFKPSQPGFYIAFSTQRTCMSLKRVRIFYYNCEGIQVGLTSFPATPSLSDSPREVEGSCATNAVPQANEPPRAFCRQQGAWLEQPEDQCHCRAGYQRKNGHCEACPMNHFKPEASGEECTPCPMNRATRRNGAKQCQCIPGYRDAFNGAITQQCYKPAGEPIIKLKSINTDSLEYGIERPLDESERVGLVYKVNVCTSKRGSDGAHDCVYKDPITLSPGTGDFTVGRLRTDTEYEITVRAVNKVSNKDDKNVAQRRFKTKLPLPGSIVEVAAEVNERTLELSWAPMVGVNYTLELTFPSGRKVTENLDDSTFTKPDLEPGSYIVELNAVNFAGEGPTYQKTITVQVGDALPIHMYGVAAAIALLFVIILIVALYGCCCRQQKSDDKKQKHGRKGEEDAILVDKSNTFNSGQPIAELQTPNGSPAAPNNYDLGPDDLMPNFDYMEINPIDIQMEKALLGEGEFAEVRKAYLVNKLGERMPVAAKKLKTGVGMRAQLDFIEEGQILQGFNHPSIIALRGVVTKYRPLMILTEFMENGSLDEYLRRNRGKVTVMEMISLLREVASGMEYLQSKGFIHRDLAARNILVDGNKSPRISDFGLSRLMDTPDADQIAPIYVAHGGKVAIKWTSPEAIKHKIFTPASDVWSFGVLCWEVMTYGDRPFWDMPNDEVIKSISMGLRLPCPQGCPTVVHELMLKCWAEEPSRRPTFGQITAELESFVSDPSQLNGNDGVFSESSTVSYNSQDNRMSSFYTTLQ